ncbi:MAG: SUMF1/EgtB/PvdO family nonheme iron enzyme [Alphaproteobacteria bacterium]|nr:SUMF1/EgtB/PvdO family nonheme iron enzyme [Alphaproteobacteria bacterium]
MPRLPPARSPGAPVGVLVRGVVLLACALLGGAGWPDASTPARTGHRAPEDAAVVITVEQYRSLPHVPYATRDAEAIYRWLTVTRGVSARQVTQVTDPTGDRIVSAVVKGAEQVGAGGTLWIFYAGLGALVPSTGLHHLLGRDDTLDHPTGPALEDLALVLADARAARVLVVVDASFQGLGRDGTPLDPAVTITDVALPAPSDPGVIIWPAAAPGQLAGPLEATRNGLFTWYVLGALQGWADGVVGAPDGQVTLEEAQVWVQRRLQALDRDQVPPVDPRPEARGWVLGPAWRAAPPDLSDLAHGPAPELPEAPLVAGPEEDDEELPLAEVEAELRSQFQERADADWAAAYAAAARKDPDATHLLERFLVRYAGWTFYWQGHLFTMSATQVPDARRLLGAGGAIKEPLVRAVRVRGGTVTLGSPAGSPGRRPDETLHTATIPHDLEVGETEVTQELWTTVTGTSPSASRGRYLPVERVSWRQALLFCNELSRLEGRDPVYEVRGTRVSWDRSKDGWRLPTEAEWTLLADPGTFPDHPDPEHACRAANVGDASLDAPPSGPLGRYACDDGAQGSSTVRAHDASAKGLYGLGGNVAEWTWDAYAPLGADPVVDPAPDRPAATRVVKGGSFRAPPHDVRTAARRPLGWDEVADDVGLRVVRTVRQR